MPMSHEFEVWLPPTLRPEFESPVLLTVKIEHAGQVHEFQQQFRVEGLESRESLDVTDPSSCFTSLVPAGPEWCWRLVSIGDPMEVTGGDD